MKITVEFESAEEFEAFKVSGKKTRTKKDEADEAGGSAPAPLAPPAGVGGSVGNFVGGGMSTAQFAPPAGGAVAGAFPAAAAPDPAIAALVARIVTKLDSAIASGQPADQALAWFKSQCGPETANYTLDQIKQQALPKLAQPVLENMAKLMGVG